MLDVLYGNGELLNSNFQCGCYVTKFYRQRVVMKITNASSSEKENKIVQQCSVEQQIASYMNSHDVSHLNPVVK